MLGRALPARCTRPESAGWLPREHCNEWDRCMAGIVAYGAYIPFGRLSRAEIARAWGSTAPPGERAVASYDEDSLTMGVAAALDCLTGVDPGTVDALHFATTTPPYTEKQCAATVATVLGLPSEAVTMDFSGSLRCATNAMKAAVDAVRSGSARRVLVCAADTRPGYPAGPLEMSIGDGAGALLLGSTDTVAEVEGFVSRFDEIQDVWRSDRDRFIRTAEDRFAVDEGYLRALSGVVARLLEKQALTPRDFTRAAIYAPNSRQLAAALARTGFDRMSCPDTLHTLVGDTGCALPIMELVAALEEATPGQRILLAGYGNGCDAFALRTTPLAGSLPARRGIKQHLRSRCAVASYERYLKWRELLPVQPPARPPIELRQPTPNAQRREGRWELRLTGSRCLDCGTPQYPRQRVCVHCRARDRFEPYTFFDKAARLFSFSHDYVMETLDSPVTVTMVDFEGGGRLMCEMTDRDPAAVEVGMPLEMTFRRLYYVGGIHNYWWKCRPVRA